MRIFSQLSLKIKNRKAKVGVVGIGYVGSALAEATSSCGFTTFGFDINKEKVDFVNRRRKKNFTAIIDTSKLSECDIICVCVPTPINKNKKPNLESLKDVFAKISKNLRAGQLIIIESSLAPGTTRGFALPILLCSPFKQGKDFFLAFSPERIDPGNRQFNIHNTPKVVGGLEENSLKLAGAFYKSFVEKVVPVTSLETAELTKVFENTFRLVNISLVNEIAAYAKNLGINIWEVVDAASTKPFGFLAHYPGPGVGGHCIPVLPYHLLSSAAKHKVLLRVVKAAAQVNELQPKKVAEKAIEIVNGRLSQKGKKPKVLLIGVSYKPETNDIRESPALKIWEFLESSGMIISYHDPYVNHINGYLSKPLTLGLVKKQDLVIITTAHKNISYEMLVKSKKTIIDTRNVFPENRHSTVIKV